MFVSYSASKNRIHRITASILLISVIFLCSAPISAVTQNKSAAVSSVSSNGTSSEVSPTPIPNPILDYKLNVNADSVIVVELGRGMRLYMKNPDLKSNIPVASKIMTAVIAIEAIPLDTKITVSKVAASQPDAADLSLVNGEKYTLEYLLYGLLLMDNNAAAVAIAEQISGEEVEFIKLMNTKALSYKMENTVFKNVTGVADAAQYTTVSDVSRLVRYALTFPKFETILKTKDIPFFLSQDQAKHLFSNIENAWSLVDTTTGAVKSISNGKKASFVVSSSASGINTITVATVADENRIIDDITTISDSIFSDYELSVLVSENQSYPKSITIGSDVINLKFNQEITYVHPKNSDFLRPATYQENSDLVYPFLTTKSVAKVVFELLDGTKITADLYPSNTVWGETSYIQKLVLLYNANSDIGMLIVIALGLLLILCIINLILVFIRLYRSAIDRERIRRAMFRNSGHHGAKEKSNGSPDSDHDSIDN